MEFETGVIGADFCEVSVDRVVIYLLEFDSGREDNGVSIVAVSPIGEELELPSTISIGTRLLFGFTFELELCVAR